MKNDVHITIHDHVLSGILSIPDNPIGIVVFAHGSGSGRFSPRNNFVAETLNSNNIATFLPDLLTEQEDAVYENRFNIELLTSRLEKIIDWIGGQSSIQGLPVGLFGASTGSAAALEAAAYLGERVVAVVSRGGRPDLAIDELGEVVCPTLLIVGGADEEVISLNKKAFEVLRCTKQLEIVAGATHLFEEEGTLEEVARLATHWFQQYMVKTTQVGKTS